MIMRTINLTESESIALRLIRSGLVQQNPVIERLMEEGLLARHEAWRVVHRLERKKLIEPEGAEKRGSGRTIHVLTWKLTKRGEELFS